MAKNKRYVLLIIGLILAALVGYYNFGAIVESGVHKSLPTVLSLIIYVYWLGYCICRVSKGDNPKEALTCIIAGVLIATALTIFIPMLANSPIGLITYWSLAGIWEMWDIVIYALINLGIILASAVSYIVRIKKS